MDGSTFFEIVQKFYDTTVFTYGTGLLTLYAVLAILSYKNINIFNRKESYSDYSMIVSSPLAPGVSIIAPAFNEGVTIIDNVRSLLTIDYPKFEVVIINDGSTD
ncbi:MAG: glycosyltransferase, partial [Chitinophagia bacterium]|nr:glycosyltransferase [Chitinophagia bacterium]